MMLFCWDRTIDRGSVSGISGSGTGFFEEPAFPSKTQISFFIPRDRFMEDILGRTRKLMRCKEDNLMESW